MCVCVEGVMCDYSGILYMEESLNAEGLVSALWGRTLYGVSLYVVS